MLKFGKISTKFRGILTVLALTAITFTVTSCKGKVQSAIDFDENYLSVGDYTATNGEVWEELQWDASKLFDDKAKEAIVQKQYNQVADAVKDANNENHKAYTERLHNYLVEAVYGFSFSLDDHDEEIEKLDEKTKETKIKQYADNIYKNYKVSLKQEQIIEALKKDDREVLKELYSLYYLPFASELFAFEKLQEEIDKKNEEDAKDKNEDTIGYFSKSQIVSQYRKEYLNQGDSKAIVIKFASQTEADETLKAFGIKVHKGQFYYLTNTLDKSFVEYKKYYDEFDFNKAKPEEYFAIADYGHAAVLQLYVAMYNYIYTYHKNSLDNLELQSVTLLDQRKTTENLLKLYEEKYSKIDFTVEADNQRMDDIIKEIEKDEANAKLISFTAEEAKKVDNELYNLIYSTLKTPAQHDREDKKGSYEQFTTSTKSIAGGYYMAFKYEQEFNKDIDGIYKRDITEDDLYQNIKNTDVNDAKDSLYDKIIKDLTDSQINQDFITEKISEAMKDVKVKIFDKEIEISYAQNHTDYNKTLSKAPNNNTIAEFKYNDTVIKYELTTEDGKGLWDILEYRNGTDTAVEIIQTKTIKDTKEYKEIKDEDMALYEESLEYILASFANNALAQQGYPATIGKYNFLMLYYHSADIEQIINDIFKVNNAAAKILNKYSDEKTIDFFYDYSKRAFDNYFSINATKVNIFLDIDEDGKADDIEAWKNLPARDHDGKTMIDVAKELYKDIYNRILASTDDHSTALKAIVDEYNRSGRFNPANGGQFDNNENNYDPIPSEWAFAKYKKLGFNISIEDITVTNSDSDKDVKIKDKLSKVYKSQDFAHKDFFPSKYLENPENADALIEVDNNLNYFLITGATKPASAKYEDYKDENNIYSNIYYMYNEKVQVVENIYNNEDLVNKNQIKAFVFEYLSTKTTNLVPADITQSLTSFVSPVLSRYQSAATQQHISINFIADGNIDNLQFHDANNLARYKEIQNINIRIADNYVTYENENYNNYHNWFENIDKLIKGGQN